MAPPLSPRGGYAKYGLFQPKLAFGSKIPKLTLRPGHTKIGTDQLTLCPISTNSLEPLSHLVPSESPTSWRQRIGTWGHDAQNGKIGVIPSGSLGSQGNTNNSQGRRSDLGLSSKCET